MHPGDLELVRHERPAPMDETGLGRGAPHVEGHEIRDPEMTAVEHGGQAAAGRSRLDEPHGHPLSLLGGGEIPTRGHDVHGRRAGARTGQSLPEPAEIASRQRLDVGVQDSGRGALVLADLGKHLVRRRHGDTGQRSPHHLGGASLIRGVAVGVEETDGHRLDACCPQALDRSLHAGRIHRLQDLARGIRPLADAEAQAAAHDGLGHAHLQVVEVVSVLAPDLQHVLEPRGGEERRARARELDDRVGDERGAVHDVGDVAWRDTGLGQDCPDAFEEAAQRVVRGRQDLGERGSARRVEQGEVSERAADVDPEAIPTHARPRSPIVMPARPRRDSPGRSTLRSRCTDSCKCCVRLGQWRGRCTFDHDRRTRPGTVAGRRSDR
jgi:hypothetical protein